MATYEDEDQGILGAFFSNTLRQQARLLRGQKRLVHYTNANVAFSILKNREVWMRNAIAMNDYSEVQYGEVCLDYAWQSKEGLRFQKLMNGAFPGISDEIKREHVKAQSLVRAETYMTCVSEHEGDEDRTGRLSMWRAYGGDNGIALVIQNKALFSEFNDLKAYASPVAYFTKEQAAVYLGKVATSLWSLRKPLKARDRAKILDLLLRSFKFATLSTKHPGFREEQEWRIIYNPTVENSSLVRKSVETVAGVPQKVYKLPVRDLSILDRVIIGPTKLPRTMRDTFVDILQDAGLKDAETRVINSDIPLRR